MVVSVVGSSVVGAVVVAVLGVSLTEAEALGRSVPLLVSALVNDRLPEIFETSSNGPAGYLKENSNNNIGLITTIICFASCLLFGF